MRTLRAATQVLAAGALQPAGAPPAPTLQPAGATRALTLAAALVAAAALGPAPASARTICEPDGHPGGEWRMMGGDYGHSRHQPAERTIGRLEAARLAPVWTFSADDASGVTRNEITGYPIVADGCLFVASSTGWQQPGWVFALNADGGDLVWKTRLPYGVYSTLAVADGRLYAYMSRVGSPTLVALDQRDGRILWQTVVDTQPGSDAVSSPIVFDGMVWVGVSGTAAEGNASTRFDFRGASVLLDARTGEVLAHEWSIPDQDWRQGQGDAGGAIWSTISVDPQTRYGYVGTGNPFNYDREHQNTNAVVKVDLDRSRPTFGKIVASYKGDVEEYFPPVSDHLPCDQNDPVGAFLAGFECGRLDLDFGAAPNLFEDRRGRRLVGAGQKSGVYHVFDPDTMQPVWKQLVGVPSAVGGIVGTAAFDGTAIYAPHTLAGYLVSLDRDTGRPRWVAPVADGVHWGNPVTSANGVIYTVDLKGFLDAYDAGTGAPLLHRPLGLGANTGASPTFTWGGVTVARNTVYASVGLGLTSVGEFPPWPSMPNGFVIAFRPARIFP